MRCSKCGTDSTTGRKFCAACGSPLSRRCARCGAENAPSSAFCEDCGAALAGNAASTATGSPQAASASEIRVAPEQQDPSTTIEGERKTVTALFADLKSSTELMEALDPEEARAIIDPALRIMIGAVRRYEGYVVQSTGDGIFALFGAPAAYEDHPQRGLYAALQMQQELREYGQRRTAQGAHSLDARVGINTGEVVVRSVETGGKIEYTPIGHTANLASRLQTLAPVGSIAVSEYTRKLCQGYFELRALGPMAVRGISEPINVYEVTGRGSLRTHFQLSARRGLTKFVGRERELEQMQRALQLAMSGHGQLVAVVAEAGTGKSRLFYEFKTTLPPACKVLEAYSVSHGKASAWLPVLELLRDYFSIQDVDEPAMRHEKVRAALNELDPALQDTLPYLFGLLGIVEGPDPLAQMDPQVKRRRTLDAIKRIILRESLKQPLVVIFEDLHWIDEQTQALLDLLADSIGNARVLLLVNYRPEYWHKWGNKGHYVQIGLRALGRESAEELLTALLEDTAELRPLKRLIIQRAGGNPFFIEEMVQALFDERILVRNGSVKVTRSLSQIRTPATVQGILAARIDRLPSDQKEVLQTLAVMGRESPFSLIRQVVSTAEPQLESILAHLRASEFIYGRPAVNDVDYIFKHALTQEVAYSLLLVERRKLIHERAGKALESMFPDQLDDHLIELAHHYRLSDNVTKAIEYLGRVGQQALQRCAPADATRSLAAAIDVLARLPDSAERIQRELPLELALGQAFILLKGWAAREVEQAFIRALEICEHMGNPPEVFFALFGLWVNHHVRGDYRAARDRARQLLRLAQSSGDHTHLVLAHYAMGETSLHTGELKLAREHQEVVLSLYDQTRDLQLAFRIGSDAKQAILSYAGWTLWLLGYPDQALATGEQAIAFARDISHPNSLAAAEFFLMIVQLYRREAPAVEETAQRVIAFSTEYGFGAWLLHSGTNRGWAIAEQGRPEEGIALMREGLATAHEAGADIGRTDGLCHLAEAGMKADRPDDALSIVTEALAAADQQEERYYEPDIHRVRGEVLLRQDGSNVEATENCFRRAIAIARKQSGKSLELRATISLARLLAKQDRRDEARAMLAEIYNWFTEGFDTADLKDAKALLEELAR
jgi:class 3 adenylate cyclase/predicted ATPase